jgi:hypothetical protein
MLVVDAARLERRREKAVKARGRSDRRPYFHGVAAARYVLRKVFRGRGRGQACRPDPLASGPDRVRQRGLALRVKEVAERLDITPAFSSSLVKMLVAKP